MDITQQQEQFSNAYLNLVATIAGCTLAKPIVDDDSVDFSIQGKDFKGIYSRPHLDVQLKCHKLEGGIGPKGLNYPLKIKNYNELRITDVLVPRLLVIVVVPEDIKEWLVQTDEQTLIKYCGYWVSIRGELEKPNKTSVSVRIPQANRLTADELRRLLQVVASGGAP